MGDFAEFIISHNLVLPEKADVYRNWVKRFLRYGNIEDTRLVEIDEEKIRVFAGHLGKNHLDREVREARYALRLFMFYLSRDPANQTVANPKSVAEQWQNLVSEMVEVIRLRRLPRSTEDTYRMWLRMFYVFMEGGKQPVEIGAAEVRDFMNYLAAERKVTADVQNQALTAILFFLGQVLDRDVTEIRKSIWSEDQGLSGR